MTLVHQATCVAIAGRALLIEGTPGAGKTTLALQLIDRGATLVGDDGVTLALRGTQLLASPPPNTAGLIEVRNLGLLTFPTTGGIPVGLVLTLDPDAPRYIEDPERVELGGAIVPMLRIWPDANAALKAELALQRYGV